MRENPAKKRKHERVDPDTGEKRIIDHHHEHRSPKGAHEPNDSSLSFRRNHMKERSLDRRRMGIYLFPIANPNRLSRKIYFRRSVLN